MSDLICLNCGNPAPKQQTVVELGGGLDANRCHHDYKNGGYHYH